MNFFPPPVVWGYLFVHHMYVKRPLQFCVVIHFYMLYVANLFQRGTVSEQKKVENSSPLQESIILVPPGALLFLNNHVYKSVSLGQLGHQNSTPIRVPCSCYGQSRSVPRGTVSEWCDLSRAPKMNSNSMHKTLPYPHKNLVFCWQGILSICENRWHWLLVSYIISIFSQLVLLVTKMCSLTRADVHFFAISFGSIITW